MILSKSQKAMINQYFIAKLRVLDRARGADYGAPGLRGLITTGFFYDAGAGEI